MSQRNLARAPRLNKGEGLGLIELLLGNGPDTTLRCCCAGKFRRLKDVL